MDYDKIEKALQTLQYMCEKVSEVSDCRQCPCGNVDNECLIRKNDPEDWNIKKARFLE